VPAYFKQLPSDAGVIPLTAATVIDPLATAVSTGLVMDVCFVEEDETSVCIAYSDLNSDVEVIMWRDESATNLVNIPSTTVSLLPNAMITTWRQRDNCAIVAYIDQASPDVLVAVGLNNTGTTIISSATIYTATANETLNTISAYPSSSTVSRIFWNVYDSSVATGGILNVSYDNTYTDSSGTGVAGTEKIFHLSVSVIFKPFLWNNLWYMLCKYHEQETRDPYKSFILIDEQGHMVGTYLYGYSWNSQGHSAAKLIDNGNGSYRFVGGKIIASDPLGTEQTVALDLVEFSFSLPNLNLVDVLHWTQIPGDIPHEFDGVNLYEQGFPWGPYISGAAVSTPGIGPYLPTGTYGYVTTYEWIDGNGHRHQSAPSSIDLVTITTSTQIAVLTLPTLSISDRDLESIQIVVYRTKVDEPVYYRLTTHPNDPTKRYITLEDRASDSSIEDNETLYTTGNTYANYPPSAYYISAVHQRRVFVVDHYEKNWKILYSKEVDNISPIEFSPFLTLSCNTDDGEITGLASQSDRLVIFKQKSIYCSHGLGLTKNGNGANYEVPYLVSEAIGCVNQKTIAKTPLGLMFDSGQGIYLLDRQFRVSKIGEQIDYYYKQVTVNAADIDKENESAIFVTSGNALVYNWKHDIWCTFTGYGGCGVVATLYGVFFCNESGSVATREDGTYRDSETGTIQIRIRTGWFSFAKIAGYQRVYRIILLGQNLDGHRLRIKTAYDFDPVWVDDQTFDSDDLGGYADVDSHYGNGLSSSYIDKAYMLDVATSRQECTSIMFEITDEELP
jgi:hypothetical protein